MNESDRNAKTYSTNDVKRFVKEVSQYTMSHAEELFGKDDTGKDNMMGLLVVLTGTSVFQQTLNDILDGLDPVIEAKRRRATTAIKTTLPKMGGG